MQIVNYLENENFQFEFPAIFKSFKAQKPEKHENWKIATILRHKLQFEWLIKSQRRQVQVQQLWQSLNDLK